MDKDKKLMLCTVSLFRISEDLKDIDATASAVCKSLAKKLAAGIEELPEATIHNVDTESLHDTNIGDEISKIVEQIKNDESI